MCVAGSRVGAETGRRVRGRRNKRERNVSCRQTDRQTASRSGGTPGTLKAAAWAGHEAECRGPMPREGPKPWADSGGRGSWWPQGLAPLTPASSSTAGTKPGLAANLLARVCTLRANLEKEGPREGN